MIPLHDKQRVLKSGLHLLQKKLSKAIYVAGRLNLQPDSKSEYLALLNYETDLNAIYGSDWRIATKLNHNEYKRVRRLRLKMNEAITTNKALFLTLTFSSDTLAKTSFQTRRRYVARYLKTQSAFYIANVDFGATKGREHYHAVLVGRSVDYALWREYGAIKGIKVRPTKNDTTRIAKYVAKLSNHAIKESAQQVRLIYSR
jgi:hypothetical protein